MRLVGRGEIALAEPVAFAPALSGEPAESTNEDLITSREEMQSQNKELQTVNAEQQSKMDELSRVNNA